MELAYSKKEIIFEKELTNLDMFVIEFADILERNKLKYVIISGYIAILFGRTRKTEDIDLFIERIPKEKFLEVWKEFAKKYDCINAKEPDDAYEYLDEGLSIRMGEIGTFEPNFEIKFVKTGMDRLTLADRVLVKLGKYQIYTSSIELQIAFKLYLGSEKDLEDARHLWILFRDYLNKEKLKYFISTLNTKDQGVLDGL
ncbi:MAG: hypothetical protein AABY09_01505 [Nanoarchaeota archaeon]